ncbi:PLC-like phosphodiesterase [Roridomyces roridus]|uniref:PLC-like phosphodiesterase n=1 Tax=Roridomyces roridus TaxID=1738132 RepID=A0AAD7FSS0_9AGAR|nr:PLC-like phosphodiesterase [Roridomyces roridus]
MLMSPPSTHFLGESALAEILERAAPILGREDMAASSRTSDWMARFSDDTRLVDMNLPGTHDTATWDYTDSRQTELIKFTGPIRAAKYVRCQDRSLLQSLHDGIRVFDLRLGFNPGHETIGFYHGVAVLAPTTILQDVLFGLYAWLIAHPTETILVSINHEAGSQTPQDKKFEEILYKTLNNDVGQKFWLPGAAELGKLGAARGKLVLLQRFTYQSLESSPPANPHGIHLGADRWTDNGADIRLVYSEEPRRVAFIEDEYKPLVPSNSGAHQNISKKFEIVVAHLNQALGPPEDDDGDDDEPVEEGLHVTFCSAYADYKSLQPVTPDIMAMGNESTMGMNERLLAWIRQVRKVEGKKRFGVVLLDFYHSEPELVEAIIGL